ncbi:MAG: hypothetical protein AMXMBFR13_27960 [Phycisphaerae bacterium]
MGLFAKLFGDTAKSDLIRRLLLHRVRNAPGLAFMEPEIRSFSDFQLLASPEGTIVTIVETWLQLIRQGCSEDDAFARIEAHRSSLGKSGTLPSPLTLSSYINYRLDLEHDGGGSVGITPGFLDMAIAEAKKVF